MEIRCDFSGWATRNDLRCSDGRTIKKDAFKGNNGKKVPLVWNHDHTGPDSVLGHAILENRDEGVYAYCCFNDSKSGMDAKEAVRHGDIRSLSIYANQLQQNGNDVMHGVIREVSLVYAGANPGAYIEEVMVHGDDVEDGMIAYYDENIMLHSEFERKEEIVKTGEKEMETTLNHSEEEKKKKTVKDVIDSFDEDQKKVFYALIAEAMGESSAKDEGDDENMKHNTFEMENETFDDRSENTLTHSQMQTVISDIKRFGSARDSWLAHADEYGVENLEWLFPEDRNMNVPPQFIDRKNDWVKEVMSGVHHSPFSRIKSMYADITEDEARAKGYIKGKYKKEEVFSLLKRSTSPTTVYKKQKFDKNDLDDITDFDIFAWVKGEMRMKLDEELARAYLIGDGRLASDDDHIDTNCIRPIVNDADLFVIRFGVAAGSGAADLAKNFITASIKSRKNYRGSGNPVLFTTEDMLTEMLLLEDSIQHKLYKTEGELATALRVSKIVTVPYLEGFEDSSSKDVYGIIVNLNDYNVGADKGGSINMFDDFDIDYNQQKYLIETRCSGSLTKPFSAIVLREGETTADQSPTMQEAMAPFKA